MLTKVTWMKELAYVSIQLPERPYPVLGDILDLRNTRYLWIMYYLNACFSCLGKPQSHINSQHCLEIVVTTDKTESSVVVVILTVDDRASESMH